MQKLCPSPKSDKVPIGARSLRVKNKKCLRISIICFCFVYNIYLSLFWPALVCWNPPLKKKYFFRKSFSLNMGCFSYYILPCLLKSSFSTMILIFITRHKNNDLNFKKSGAQKTKIPTCSAHIVKLFRSLNKNPKRICTYLHFKNF